MRRKIPSGGFLVPLAALGSLEGDFYKLGKFLAGFQIVVAELRIRLRHESGVLFIEFYCFLILP